MKYSSDREAAFAMDEEEEFIMQEIERDELERMNATEAHKKMFGPPEVLPTTEEIDEIASRYGV